MASTGTLYITEFPAVQQGGAPIVQWPPTARQVAAVGAANVATAPFNQFTNIIRVKSDMDCLIDIGINPNAQTSPVPLSAGETEYFGVNPGWKLAVIALS